MLHLALGIIGATVMPHNLYPLVGIVRTRASALLPEVIINTLNKCQLHDVGSRYR